LTQQQLANVLIKILGLWMLYTAIPTLIVTIVAISQSPGGCQGDQTSSLSLLFITPVLGIVIMLASKPISRALFEAP